MMSEVVAELEFGARCHEQAARMARDGEERERLKAAAARSRAGADALRGLEAKGAGDDVC